MKLVLLPGMDGTGLMFAPFVEALDGRLDSLAVAYPGDGPQGYEDLLPAVLEALPVREPFILLGESFSGPLAIMAAATRPARLRALVLVSTFIGNPIPWLPRAARHLAKPLLFRGAPPFIQLLALAAGRTSPPLRRLVPEVYRRVPPEAMAARARAILAADVGQQLSACAGPVYFIGGEQDRLTPRVNLRAVTRVRPDVVVRLFPGPHLILQARPRETAQALVEMALTVAKG